LAQINNLENKEELLPIGWQFVYLPELLADMKVSKGEQKKIKIKSVSVKRKPWANTTLI